MAHAYTVRHGLRVYDGTVATGNELAPDVVSGGLCLHTNDNGKVVSLKANALTHGLTDVAETDTYAALRKENDTLGGLRLSGYSGNSKGVSIQGYAATTYTGLLSSSQGTVVVDAYKKSGTAAVALADNENIFALRNGGTTQLIVKGGGDLYLREGGLRLGENAAAVAGMLRYASSTPDVEFYDGSAWVSLTETTTATPGGLSGELQFNDAGTFGGTSAVTYDSVNSRLLTGDVVVGALSFVYLGDPDTDGSWRFALDAGTLTIQKRIAGVWETHHTFA